MRVLGIVLVGIGVAAAAMASAVPEVDPSSGRQCHRAAFRCIADHPGNPQAVASFFPNKPDIRSLYNVRMSGSCFWFSLA